MAANLQRSAVRDTLSQFREPWAKARSSAVLYHEKTHMHAINYELSLPHTPLPEAVHVHVTSVAAAF